MDKPKEQATRTKRAKRVKRAKTLPKLRMVATYDTLGPERRAPNELEEARAAVRRHLNEAFYRQHGIHATNMIKHAQAELERRQRRQLQNLRALYRQWQSEPMIHLPRSFNTSNF